MSFFRREIAFARILSSPQATLVLSFAGIILIGAILLRLPWSHEPGKVSFVDALFTATSAVCVTGLTVLDTGKDYTLLGQGIILLLIQAGGLGIMTFAALFYEILGRRMTLQSKALVSDTFFQRDIGSEFRSTFRTILIITFCVEGAGVLSLFVLLPAGQEWSYALWWSVFHSISAFCNAGFSINTDNLMIVRGSRALLFVVMGLIVLGGLGYLVLHEVWARISIQDRIDQPYQATHFSLHARVVLTVSGLLIVGGSAALLVFGLTPEETSWDDRLLHSLFQSITARTAGFNTVDIGRLPSASLLVLIGLMFIGGSPSSCAGGVKTTTLAIWLARLRASIRGEREVRLLDRRLGFDLVNRADLLFGLAVFWNVIGVFLLLWTQSHLPVGARELAFEQISAFGTVGLSTGVTPNLSTFGKLWIIATMFVGRLGPLTVALWVFPPTTVHVRYPKGTVMIG
ncbi:MAG: potassium transporter TrkG [Thermodesulfobacteriota bacterium]